MDNETRKKKQLEIILRENPCNDTFHTWIRTKENILTLEEALKEEDYIDYEYFTSDYTRKDGEKALKNGTIVVYSSKKIKQGTFVTPSYEEARGYAGTQNPVYSKKVSIEDIAWIDVLQGQYAKVKEPLKK